MEKNWGIKIKELREIAGMIQSELADKSGIERSHLSRIELGHYKDAREELLIKLAKGLDMTLNEIRIKIYDIKIPAGSPQEWEKHASDQPFLKVSVYSDYARVHAGEPVSAIDHLYVDRPEKAPFNIKAYRVEGDCMEPMLHDGEYVIVDHDRAIDNGDKVVCLLDGDLHIAKLKIIGSEYWLQNRHGTRKMTDCQGIAKVIGHYGKEA